jgi:hypothetical protein
MTEIGDMLAEYLKTSPPGFGNHLFPTTYRPDKSRNSILFQQFPFINSPRIATERSKKNATLDRTSNCGRLSNFDPVFSYHKLISRPPMQYRLFKTI